MTKEKKGLGIGLEALFGADEPEENELQILPIAKVEPRLEQPREIFNEQADAFFQPEQNESIYGCMTTAIRFALQNKTAMVHIFNSANREMFERYLNSVAARTVESYVEYYTANYRISDENREALVLYYKSLLIGFVMDWLSGGMRYDLAEKLRRVCGVFEGTFDNAMRNCSKMKE